MAILLPPFFDIYFLYALNIKNFCFALFCIYWVCFVKNRLLKQAVCFAAAE